MKNGIKILLLFMLLGAACTKENSPYADSARSGTGNNTSGISDMRTGRRNPVPPFVTGSLWEITSLVKNGTEQSPFFAGFVFMFNGDGTVNATRQSENVAGIWISAINDNPAYFQLRFRSSNQFALLNDDWYVVKMGGDIFYLKAVDGAAGSSKILHFKKVFGVR